MLSASFHVQVLLCLLSGGVLAAPQTGWPTGSVKHRYFDTPNGQIHYVLGGGAGQLFSKTPLVFQHGHPRSTVEFKYLAAKLKQPFIALDYFSMGLSEDYKGKDENDLFCSFQQWASYVLKILDHEHVRSFVSMGSLKGAHPALELAAQAGARVKDVVLMNPLILNAKGKQFIDGVLIPMLKNAPLASNGSHVLAAWNDPSAAPLPMASDEDLVINEEKTMDSLRAMANGWQYDAAWTAYNDQNVPRMHEVDGHARSLFLYGEGAVTNWAKYGLDPESSQGEFAKAATHNKTVVIPGGSEGMACQKADSIAQIISDFLKSSGALVV